MRVPAVLRAPAKLTLSLRVLGVRPDGLHRIDAEMVSLDLADTLWVGAGTGVRFDGPHGGEVGEDDDDLVTRALRVVGRNVRISVDKQIPSGAGLGGGSADAAAVLRWAGRTDLAEAARLGADVPFCLLGGRARVTGVGERVQPRPPIACTYTLLIPPVRCPTGAVYAAWDELGGPLGSGTNDLEPAALHVTPDLARWRDELGEASGDVPRLAGSGSTWFVEGAHPGPGRRVVHTTGPATG